MDVVPVAGGRADHPRGPRGPADRGVRGTQRAPAPGGAGAARALPARSSPPGPAGRPPRWLTAYFAGARGPSPTPSTWALSHRDSPSQEAVWQGPDGHPVRRDPLLRGDRDDDRHPPAGGRPAERRPITWRFCSPATAWSARTAASWATAAGWRPSAGCWTTNCGAVGLTLTARRAVLTDAPPVPSLHHDPQSHHGVAPPRAARKPQLRPAIFFPYD